MANPFVHVELNTADPEGKGILFQFISVATVGCAKPAAPPIPEERAVECCRAISGCCVGFYGISYAARMHARMVRDHPLRLTLRHNVTQQRCRDLTRHSVVNQ